MPEYIGDVEVPAITPSGTFPLVSDYPHGYALAPEVAVHQFGSGNAKIEQRFLLGNGSKRFFVRKAALNETDREALRDFWENNYGPYGAFTYNAPNDDSNGTTAYICRFANEPLSWEFLSDAISTIGVTLIEIPDPDDAPTYTLNSTETRFPGSSLKTALLSQVQTIVPLIKIQPREVDYPAIYVSDRRCTVGTQPYLPRLLEFEGIQQSIGNASDEARFTFGNADRVMCGLVNDTNLNRATIEFSLFHVGTGIKLNLWKGEIAYWEFDDGPEFRVTASDGLYELNLPYPCRKISRTCWKSFDDGAGCPFTAQGSMDLVHFPSGDDTICDKSYDGANGCLAHGMKKYFGGILAEPQSVTIKDNSTGTWGWRRSSLTSVSLVAESIYDQVIPEIYTDSDMPVNAKIAAGRDESDYYDALGIVGEGPITFGNDHKLDGQFHHGHPGSLGLRAVPGSDPAGATEYFSLGQNGVTGGDWRKAAVGLVVYKDNFAAGTAFLELRRQDEKGLQLSQVTGHQMQAVVRYGLQGWVWTASETRTWQILTNPIWIVTNAMLRARGLRYASAAVAEGYFDVTAAIAAAAICDTGVTPLIDRTENVWVPEEGEEPGHWETAVVTSETQFKFRGILQEEKPLRDWIQEILMNCLGYYSFSFGKLRLGIRINSSVVEAFTEGNIIFHSLQTASIRPGFNHLSANFADAEFDGATNSVQVYDIDHAKLVGGASAPQFVKSQMNLSGVSHKSQAARIVATRLREELGGITEAQWAAARELRYQTTVLALNVEPGMVCSMTHADMPGGAGEFRAMGWRLNGDYSIDIDGRTTVDEMYDLTTGPRPEDVQADPVPVENPSGIRCVGGKSVGGVGATDGNPTASELFIQDDTNHDVYRRKIKVEFSPPPTAYNTIFTRRTLISFLEQATTGGAIPGSQTVYVEVVPRKDSVDGLPSATVAVVIPAGTSTNTFSVQAKLPSEATHYSVRIGSHPGRMYLLGAVTSSPGTDWFDIAITNISSLNSASLTPDPLFAHVRFFYYYSGRANELHDAGKTADPTQAEFTFEPEVPQAGDTSITVIACAANADETDVYPLEDAPSITFNLALDTGNPSGASGLTALIHQTNSLVPPEHAVFEFSPETANANSIMGVAAVISIALPAEGPYSAERSGNPTEVIETGTCTVTAGSKTVAVSRTPDTAVLDRVLVIWTADGSPDSDLEGEIIDAQSATAFTIHTPFHKSGTFSYAVIKRWYDTATPDTANTLYVWFPIDQIIKGPDKWRTPAYQFPARVDEDGAPLAWSLTLYCRNIFGVGTRMTAAFTIYDQSNPTDLILPSAPSELTVTTPAGRGTGAFYLSWIPPVDGAETLCDVCIQYDTVTTFDADPKIIGMGVWKTYYTIFDPEKTYYFRVAAKNESAVGSNAVVKAALDGISYPATAKGWGPFCSYIGPRTSLHILDYNTRRVREQDLGVAIVQSNNLSGNARSQHGVFFETFETNPVTDGWLAYVTPGGVQSLVDNVGQAGGKAFQTTGVCAYIYPKSIPFEPSKLYRIRCRIKRTAGGTPGTNYIGVMGRNGNDDAYTYASGSNPHYNCCFEVTPTAGVWTDYTGWFKGWADPAPYDASTDPTAPKTLDHDTRYFRPILYLNYGGNDTVQLDEIAIDIVDEDGGTRPYRGLDSSGDLARDIKSTTKISGRAESIATTVGRLTAVGALTNADDIAGDGSTYKRITANQQTGATRGYTGLDDSGDVSRNVKTNKVVGDSILALNVTAGKISVTYISDIKTDLGTITAGTIRGATIETAAIGARFVISGSGARQYDAGDNVVFETYSSGIVWVKSITASQYVNAETAFYTGSYECINSSGTFVGSGGVNTTGDLKTTGVIKVDNVQVLGPQGAHIADATDLASVISGFNTLLSRLETHGALASS